MHLALILDDAITICLFNRLRRKATTLPRQKKTGGRLLTHAPFTLNLARQRAPSARSLSLILMRRIR